MKKPLAVLAIASIALACIPLVQKHPFLRFNGTPSMPRGLYAVDYKSSWVPRGTPVLACLPQPMAAWAQARDYIGRGDCPNGSEALLKTVAAVPGDTVVITKQGLLVNGVAVPNTVAEAFDSKGRDMPRPQEGSYKVPADAVWLIAGADVRSFDSRYFAAVPADSIFGVAHPLLTY